MHRLRGLHAPDAQRLIAAARRNKCVLKAHVNVANLLLVTSQRRQQPSVIVVPDLDEIVVGTGEYVATSTIEAHAVDRIKMAQDALVHAHRLIRLGRHHVMQVDVRCELTLDQIEHHVETTGIRAIVVIVGRRAVELGTEKLWQRLQVGILGRKHDERFA